MDGAVLAVDRQHGDVVAIGSRHDETTGHHEHFLVRQGDRLAGLDRRQHGLKRGRARRGAHDDVDFGMRRDSGEAVRAGDAGQARSEVGAQRLANTVHRLGRGHRDDGRREPRHLFRQARRVLAGGQADDAQFVGMGGHDGECAGPDGTSRPEYRNAFHADSPRSTASNNGIAKSQLSRRSRTPP